MQPLALSRDEELATEVGKLTSFQSSALSDTDSRDMT